MDDPLQKARDAEAIAAATLSDAYTAFEAMLLPGITAKQALADIEKARNLLSFISALSANRKPDVTVEEFYRAAEVLGAAQKALEKANLEFELMRPREC